MAGKKYTKADLIDSINQKTGMNRDEIRDVVDRFVDEIKNALVEQRVIELRGFGTFEVKIRKGRQNARNPRTGEVISVKSHGTVSYRAGRELKQAVWNLSDEKGSLASPRKPAKPKSPNDSKE